MEEKVYIFVSHSHYDIEPVRKIRNYLESLNAEPILFFLKSKSDEDEITNLIEDEIDARIWFIYCDSKNARESLWVTKEISYALSKGKENILNIDVDDCLDETGELKDSVKKDINNTLSKIRSLQTLYISYSRHDEFIVRRIRDGLSSYGIKTFMDFDMNASCNFIETSIEQLEQSRMVLFFASNASLRSEWVNYELAMSAKGKKEILPILMYNSLEERKEIQAYINQSLPFLRDMQSIYFSTRAEEIDKSISELMGHLYNLLK